MLRLQLDTTVAKLAKAKVFNDGQVLAEAENEQPLTAIAIALKKSNLRLGSIDKFEANPGPGSFTGIRVGAVVVNTLNWVLKKDSKLIEPVYE